MDPSNPYRSPEVSQPLQAAEAPIVYRDPSTVMLLMFVTLGFYGFYLVYQWTRDINRLAGSEKFSPQLVFWSSLASCGMAAIVFECLFAMEVEQATARRQLADRREQLGSTVVVLNVVATVISFLPCLILIALPIGCWATYLMQLELNKLSLSMAAVSAPPA